MEFKTVKCLKCGKDFAQNDLCPDCNQPPVEAGELLTDDDYCNESCGGTTGCPNVENGHQADCSVLKRLKVQHAKSAAHYATEIDRLKKECAGLAGAECGADALLREAQTSYAEQIDELKEKLRLADRINRLWSNKYSEQTRALKEELRVGNILTAKLTDKNRDLESAFEQMREALKSTESYLSSSINLVPITGMKSVVQSKVHTALALAEKVK